jgi:hypothetical protein
VVASRLQLGRSVERPQIAAAALVGLLFTGYLAVRLLVTPPTEADWAGADPILHILPRWAVWLVVAGGAIAAAGWWVAGRPARDEVVAGAGQLLLGGLFAALAVAALRLIAGPELPAAIPAEESAAPGFALSMAAGYGEELLFRLALAPLVYLPLAPRLGRLPAIAIAAVITGLAFALVHEAGGGDSSTAYFVIRTLIPGAGMTVAFFAVGPSFLIGAHGTAHLLIPAVFVAA